MPNWGFDFSVYPVQADLTADGVQYSTEISTTIVDTDVTAFSYTFNLGFPNADTYMSNIAMGLLWYYIEIHCMFKANSSGSADIKWKAQCRNSGGTWTDLFSYVTYGNIGTSYIEKTYKGYANLPSTFDEVPFDFKIVFQCNEVNEGRAKLLNTSYFRAVFKEAPA